MLKKLESLKLFFPLSDETKVCSIAPHRPAPFNQPSILFNEWCHLLQLVELIRPVVDLIFQVARPLPMFVPSTGC